MRERPILFSAPMVRAILEGRKTQTRRAVNVDTLRVRLPRPVRGDGPWSHLEVVPGTYRAKLNDAGAVTICSAGSGFDFGVKPGEFHFVCPYADGDTHLGDYGSGRKVWTLAASGRLWVREAFVYRSKHDRFYYRADHPAYDPYAHDGWKPSIHMPRCASRITLEVTGVRVERVQAISKDDAIAEGAQRFDDIPDLSPYGQGARWSMEDPQNTDHCLGSPQMAFANLWIKINGQESWDANPWVWVVSFARVIAEHDEQGER